LSSIKKNRNAETAITLASGISCMMDPSTIPS
jgi:hypothetical protein